MSCDLSHIRLLETATDNAINRVIYLKKNKIVFFNYKLHFTDANTVISVLSQALSCCSRYYVTDIERKCLRNRVS